VANFHHEFILTNGGRFVQKDDPLPAQPNPADFERFDDVARRTLRDLWLRTSKRARFSRNNFVRWFNDEIDV
jgi:hypothetical protein